MEKSNINERVSQLKKLLGVKIPPGTLRRWTSEGLIFKPELEIAENGERCWVWPPETVEDAAVIYTLRSGELPWGKTTKGWPRTKKGTESTTIKTKSLLETKKMVQHLYASANKDILEFTDFNDLFHLKPIKFPREGVMFGGYEMHPIFVTWVTTLEKIRRNKPLSEPLKVVFNWRVHVVHEDGRESFKCKYDEVTVEHCESWEDDAVHFSIKYTTEAAEAVKKKCGKQISGPGIKLTPSEKLGLQSKIIIDILRERGLKLLRERGIDVDSAGPSNPEFREMLSEAIVEASGGLVKRAKQSEWGVPPWILDDLGLLGKSPEEIDAGLQKLKEEQKAKPKTDSSNQSPAKLS